MVSMEVAAFMLHFISSRYAKNLQLVSISSRVYTFVLIGLIWEVFMEVSRLVESKQGVLGLLD